MSQLIQCCNKEEWDAVEETLIRQGESWELSRTSYTTFAEEEGTNTLYLTIECGHIRIQSVYYGTGYITADQFIKENKVTENSYEKDVLLLGQKVKVGQRVKLRNRHITALTEGTGSSHNYPFTLKVNNGVHISINSDGLWVKDRQREYDVIEILSTEESEVKTPEPIVSPVQSKIKGLPTEFLSNDYQGHYFKLKNGNTSWLAGCTPFESKWKYFHVFNKEGGQQTHDETGYCSAYPEYSIIEYIGETLPEEPLVIEAGKWYGCEDENVIYYAMIDNSMDITMFAWLPKCGEWSLSVDDCPFIPKHHDSCPVLTHEVPDPRNDKGEN